MRFFIHLSYDGTNYHGWQKQPNAHTIQEEVESCISKVIGSRIQVVGCGRTDKGVHSSNYPAHFDCSHELDIQNVHHKLNRVLPKDLACLEIYLVDDRKHARFDALRRTYEYKIHIEKNPFISSYSSYMPILRSANFRILEQVAKRIEQTTDFTAFCKAHTDNKTMNCRIISNSWTVDAMSQTIKYEICADRFLRGMVRLIVGSSVNVALGKMTFEELSNCITSGTRTPHMSSAPPQGLNLKEVCY